MLNSASWLPDGAVFSNALPWLIALPTLGWRVALVGGWLGLVVLVAEGLHRGGAANPEVVRKVVHIGTGNVILLAWWLQIPAWIGVLAAVVFSAIALLSYYIPIFTSINGVGRKSLGTFFYAVSIGVLIAWFWPVQQPQYAALGVLVMTWGGWVGGTRWATLGATCLSGLGHA
ncbi:hypothetical protein [Neosynechococcus sphagnicola]|uniref:hypothetical protein n=1 Tax=Neosynechococcus sphagnicola TaxID=1501145 RepID=UPI0030843BB2